MATVGIYRQFAIGKRYVSTEIVAFVLGVWRSLFLADCHDSFCDFNNHKGALHRRGGYRFVLHHYYVHAKYFLPVLPPHPLLILANLLLRIWLVLDIHTHPRGNYNQKRRVGNTGEWKYT